MTRLTGGQAIVKSLRAHGVDTIFGLPGVQLDHLFNALYDERNAIRVLNARHEQACAYMAFGYARASGRVGVYAVVPGPGLLNTTAALATAQSCYTPVLALSGQIASRWIEQGVGLLHEIPDQLGLISHLTKWSARIDDPTNAPALVCEAFKQMSEGVQGPVELEMAMDLLGVASEVRLLEPAQATPRPEPDPDALKAAAKLLGKAKRPLIVAGGGVNHAREELLSLAEMLQAPVVTYRMGRGVIDDRHYLSQTQAAGHRLWADADVVLGVGTRMQQHLMNWGTDADLKIIRIDLDRTRMHRITAPTVGIIADAKEALTGLLREVTNTNTKRASREDELTTLRTKVMAELDDKAGIQTGFVKALREALPEDGILVEELTQVSYVARTTFPVYAPRTFISSGYQGTLGSGFATALGAKVACPDTPVLSINGDGGFMYNVQELSTAAKHGIDIVCVVFSDAAFGNVRRMQQDDYGGKVIASDLHNPDFIKLAESFGVHGVEVETPQALRSAVESGFSRKGMTLINVPVGKMVDPFGLAIPNARVRPMR